MAATQAPTNGAGGRNAGFPRSRAEPKTNPMTKPFLFAPLLLCLFAALPAPANAFYPMNEPNTPAETTETVFDVPVAKQTAETKERVLHAGPISVKLAGGELRYLSVGDREIVRRIYFAVRDAEWDTATPVFDRVSIKVQKNSFVVDLSAHCVLLTADFSWTGKITGTPDGKITFSVTGQPNRDFKSNRIGICVLYGAPFLAGRSFETVGVDGKTLTPQTFPSLVSASLLTQNFETLRYHEKGLKVSVGVSGQATFSMEDQRTYSDSSYKAYSTLNYNYAEPVKKGDTKTETVTVSVSGMGTPAPAAKETVYTLGIGGAIPGALVPEIGEATPEETGGIFGNINNNASKYAGAKNLTWGYNPSLHLGDNDTFVENAVTIVDQVKTAHVYAPDAKIRISPVTFDSTHPRNPPHDARIREPFGDMWTVLMVKNLSLAGANSAGFRVVPGDDTGIIQSLGLLAGRPVLTTTVSGGSGVYPVPVEAFAVKDASDTVLYVLNTSSQMQTIAVPTVPGLRLKPFEVVMLRVP